MADVKISALPTKTVASTDIVPVVDAGATTTSRVTAGAIAALGGGAPAAHKTTHATGGTDALTASDIGAASSSHSHGGITSDGKIGSTANLPIITGSGGTLAAGSFGSSANTFCQGNDSRLSDSRTPTAHKTSHSTGGSDALAPSDIGAIASDTTGISGADAVTNIVSLTQAEYDALGSYNSSTLYIIT
jgi:hypothetical protein